MTAIDGTAGDPAPRLEAPPSGGRLREADGEHTGHVKPLLRGWMHLAWFEASLVLGTLVAVYAHGTLRTTAVVIFAASVSGMFGVSALYHRCNWTATWRGRLQRLDHTMILLLIACTATPAFLLTTHGALRVTCLAVMWVLTLTALGIRMAWMDAPERLVGSIYIGLGWMAGLALPAVWLHSGATAGALMLAGGLLYTAGALSYHRRWPDPSPAVFGYHEVFHVFVCAAATCHFVAIALFIA